MNYTEEELKMLHNIELEILDEIIRICNNNGIKYYLVSGSALGAIRHGGFIPWDDDIDVALFRNDYDLFFECCKTELNKTFFLQHFYTDKNYNNYFIKIRKNGTLFETKADAKLKMNKGIFVDVFPLDGLPSHYYLYKKKIMFAYQLFIAKSTTGISSSDYYCVKKIVRILLHACLIFVSKKHLYNKLDSILRKNSVLDDGYVYEDGVCVKTCYYLGNKTNVFEGRNVNVPGEIDSYLRTIYGDSYMEMPPLNKRINHKPEKIEFEKKSNDV